MNDLTLRAGQIEMVEAVGQAIELGQDLIVEVGTGVGKTLGYLLPALESDERVLISTATHALQTQLMQSDMPMALRMLDKVVNVGQLKGRRSYVCLLLAEQAVHRVPTEHVDLYKRLMQWVRVSRHGDLTEVGVDGDHPLVGLVTASHDQCVGTRCSHYEQCFVMKARQRAEQCQVLVVNHHLLLTDLRLSMESDEGLLADFSVRIIDEAHDWPEIAWQVLVDHCSDTSLIQALKWALVLLSRADYPSTQIQIGLNRCLKDVERMRRQFEALSCITTNDANFSTFTPALLSMAANLARALDDWRQQAPHESSSAPARQTLTVHFRRLRRFLEARHQGEFGWIRGEDGHFSIRVAPADIAKGLSEAYAARPGAWIATSATLSLDGCLDFFKRASGWSAAAEKSIASPFDYALAVQGWAPKQAPNVGTPAHMRWMVEQVRWISESQSGGILVLMTSLARVQELGALLRVSQLSRPIGVQGEKSAKQLLHEFKSAGNGILIGSKTFWRGVDVPGSPLSVVFIEKLPFPNPADPVVMAHDLFVKQHGGRPFEQYYVPQAVLALRQGVGRLMRSEHDRGWIVIGDNRLYDPAYGHCFRNNLPAIEWVAQRAGLVKSSEQNEVDAVGELSAS